MQLWKVKDHGDIFTILASDAETAKEWYKKHMKDIDVPVSNVDIDSIEPVPHDETINVNYPSHNDIEVSLKAEQWVAICDTANIPWNILCSSAWV